MDERGKIEQAEKHIVAQERLDSLDNAIKRLNDLVDRVKTGNESDKCSTDVPTPRHALHAYLVETPDRIQACVEQIDNARVELMDLLF